MSWKKSIRIVLCDTKLEETMNATVSSQSSSLAFPVTIIDVILSNFPRYSG